MNYFLLRSLALLGVLRWGYPSGRDLDQPLSELVGGLNKRDKSETLFPETSVLSFKKMIYYWKQGPVF